MTTDAVLHVLEVSPYTGRYVVRVWNPSYQYWATKAIYGVERSSLPGWLADKPLGYEWKDEY